MIMDNKNFSHKFRIFLKKAGLKQKDLQKMFGIAQPTASNIVTGRDRLGRDKAIEWGKVLGVDPLWLMTQGEQGLDPTAEPQPTAIETATPDDVINVPVINLDVRGGLQPNAEVDVAEYNVATMPFSRTIATEGDFVVPVFGDSMTPRYPSGSHILIRPLPMWREWLELGQSYVLELADFRRTIKIVRKGGRADTYRLDCYNPDYDSTEIPLTMIEHVFQVLAVFKREVM